MTAIVPTGARDMIELGDPHPHPTSGARYGFAWEASGSKPLGEWFTADYSAMWRTQPALRRVVEFIARNVAQLPIHVYRRLSDTDRVRLTDHPLATTLSTPNPSRMTRYRWVEAIVADLCLFDRTYTAHVGGGAEPAELLWLPAAYTSEDRSAGVLHVSGIPTPVPLASTFRLAGYSPTLVATPPAETLRAILAEDAAATRYRAELWANAARLSGWIGRPQAAPEWSDPARERFRAEWHGRWTSGAEFAGGTPVLEEGMEFHPATATAQETQYVEARQLTAVECAAAYQVPPPMVGILENANYSSTKEWRKAVYQDTLGPWLEMLSGELERQLLPLFDDVTDVYVEFAINAKLAGSFDEQAELLTRSVGAPWMTRNEARARMNLPRVEEGDELIIPLNVLVGGQASPVDPIPAGLAAVVPPAVELPPVKAVAESSPTDDAEPPALPRAKARPRTRSEAQAELVAALVAYFAKQEHHVSAALAGGANLPGAFDHDVQDPPLADLLANAGYALALTGAATVLTAKEAERFNPKVMLGWLGTVGLSTAHAINITTYQQLADPKADLAHVYEVARTARAANEAHTWDTTTHNFGAHDAARKTGRRFKVWRTLSKAPRASHARLNGARVGLDEVFANGGRYPGDPALTVDERARCSCVVEYLRED